MDSDGHVTVDGHCTFVGNDQLSSDLLALLRTLGQVARRVWRARPEDRSGGIWKVNFKPRGEIIPFRLERKVHRVQRASVSLRRSWVTITAIEPIPSVPVRCIEVDSPDHLFLAGEAGHVTHNTESWLKRNGGHDLAYNQRRGLAGMGGRFLSTPNAYDPTEDSVAQRTAESKAPGVYHDDVDPGPGSVRNRQDRRRMLRKVYGDAATRPRRDAPWEPWVDLDRIDSEIVSLLEEGEAAQAERWFLNRKQAGESAAFDGERYDQLAEAREVPAGSVIVIGVDGARFVDALAVVGTDVVSGYQWTIGIWERPKDAKDDYEHPQDEVDGAVTEAFERWSVWRLYADPQKIEGLLDKWQGRWGSKRVMAWYTNRPRQMCWAVRTFSQAIGGGDLSHDGDPVRSAHVKNAKKRRESVLDDERRQMHTICKDGANSPRSIDGAVASVLSWECRGDAIAAGAQKPRGKAVLFV